MQTRRSPERIDYHSHILPGIDDGSENVEMSLEMVKMLADQGIGRVIATPHFYCHREKSLERFLEKRKLAYDELMSASPAIGDIRLGAEISVEKDISKIDGIEQLAIEGTRLILMEFPYSGFAPWQISEIENICYKHDLQPMIAHLHRYIGIYAKSDLERILEMGAVFQINNEAFKSFGERRFAKKIIAEKRYTFGSDCHNTTSRKPNTDIITKRFAKDPEIIAESDRVYTKYEISR